MINPHFHNIKVTVFDLHREIETIKHRTHTGVLQAAMLIRGYAQDICPVDTGNLKASAFVTWKYGTERGTAKANWSHRKSDYTGEPRNVSRLKADHRKVVAQTAQLVEFGDVVIGFSAYYAGQAHEEHHTIGERHFLTKAVERKREDALDIIHHTAEGRGYRAGESTGIM